MHGDTRPTSGRHSEGETTMTIAILLTLELICLTCLQDSRHDAILAAELGLDSLDR